MKKFYSFVAMLLCGLASLQAQTTIYAYKTWQPSDPTNCQKGPIKFSSDDPSNVTLIADQSKMGVTYAGTYYNYKWYAQITKIGTQSSVEGLYTIDLNDGTRTLISNKGSQLTDLTYDYTTNTMFAIKNGAEYLSTLNIETGEVTNIAVFKNELDEAIYMLALACDLDGTLYGIASNDILYTIDKATAACTPVGETGVNASFTQSMGFDHNNGVLYWVNAGDYHLYSVNTETGEATDLGAVGANGDDSVTSVFVPYIHAPKGAPDRVTERNFTISNKDVTISWKNPEITAQGEALTEYTGVKILRNGEELTTITLTSAEIGTVSSYTDKNLADGNYSYRIVPTNSKGEGGVDTDNLNIIIGPNAPAAPGNFKAEQGDNTAELSWTKPTEGMYGGEFDPNSITKYIITRIVGTTSKTIEVNDPNATSYSDAPGFGTFTYKIKAVNNIGEGAEVSANPVLVKPANWIVMMTGETVVDAGKTYKFYDAGGTDYYPNSQNEVLTIRPSEPNTAVCMKFNTFVMDTYSDTLYVYNGLNTEAPLIGKYSATAVPADLIDLQATNTDGALTFRFVSDIMMREQGWEADVTVVERKENDLKAVALYGNNYPAVNEPAVFTFHIMNNGIKKAEANSYKVKLLNAAGNTLAESQGVALNSMETAEISLEWTPTTVEKTEVYAVIEASADNDTENNKSNPIAVSVIEEGSKFVRVGEHTDLLAVNPISFMSDESISQNIYLESEINVEKGFLQMISFPMEATTNYINVPLKVWVSTIDKDNLDDSSVPASQMTLVMDGNCPIKSGEKDWVMPFNTPFEYNGGNLLVMVYKKAPGTSAEGIEFYGTYGDYQNDPNWGRFESTWSPDESLDPEANFGYSASPMRPDIKMLFTPNNGGNVESVASSNIAVYPNPVVSTVYISGNVKKAMLTNVYGQTVFTGENINSIDMTSLQRGTYILTVQTEQGNMKTAKIIKR